MKFLQILQEFNQASISLKITYILGIFIIIADLYSIITFNSEDFTALIIAVVLTFLLVVNLFIFYLKQ